MRPISQPSVHSNLNTFKARMSREPERAEHEPRHLSYVSCVADPNVMQSSHSFLWLIE